jgi:ribosomal protein S18 acetylase RimI-like enzyme
MTSLLDEIEAYYDAVPRTAARAESIGPFTLFVNPDSGWTYYARPSLGSTSFSVEDCWRVRERQRALGVPESTEWVAETTPRLREVVEGAGFAVEAHPLLVLDSTKRPRELPSANVEARFVTPDDDVALHAAVATVAFDHAGTAIGPEGIEALKDAASRGPDTTFERSRLASGATVMAAVYHEGWPVAIAMHQPLGCITEVVGVATLPAFRRRGLASVVTRLVVDDALRRGAETVFLTADDDEVARIYEGLGFRRIATACIAYVAGS